jgi:hypothetical protein
MKEKDFPTYWAELEKLKVLPEMAIKLLPSSLSLEMKQRLMSLKLEETVEVLEWAIEQVNRGSVESIDNLLRKRL